MAGQSRRWMILVATVWIQAFTGTNFDFSSYSSELKAVMGISQLQLNYLAVASDLGKAFGWSCGLALLYLPLPIILLLAAALGLCAYGAQWLLITSRISLSYDPVFFLCFLAGLSICWFNTVCFVLCIRNFSSNRPLAISLTVSFNGVSAALYTLAARAIDGSPTTYLFLNAILPILTSLVALLLILRQPPAPYSYQTSAGDNRIFLILNVIAFLTGLYLLLLNSASLSHSTCRLLFAGALIILALPLGIPGIICGRELVKRAIYCCKELIFKDQLEVLGEEHGAKRLITRADFWLYYISYLCGGTVGLVYSNNLGQIAQSLGRQTQTAILVNIYSSCSFFGRLISAAPDLLDGKVRLARTGWLAVALVPMPFAFFVLAEVENGQALLAATALVGLSSGFVFAAAVSVTSELFGSLSFGVNHNIIITNIPLGSLLYGLLAALIYDDNDNEGRRRLRENLEIMGRHCYAKTFLAWACISLLGLACGVALCLRTRDAYKRATKPGGRRSLGEP
ncbi:hypothetical protein AXF42_Ash019752 [Apostasia shenzhenica]|uniref:Uncharacterized protein n=1 Tax=Apostasia shenzhenica TaxID=1088818 RepID=A0A2H9ZRS1_9ASPA|nr:hypothetical protein AXF42_Ash019752 [Apostasia shenzhenica]